MPKGEKLGNISPLNIRKQVRYIEKGPTKISETEIKSQDINVPEKYRKEIEDLIENNRDVIANSDKELGRTRTVQMNPPL